MPGSFDQKGSPSGSSSSIQPFTSLQAQLQYFTSILAERERVYKTKQKEVHFAKGRETLYENKIASASRDIVALNRANLDLER